MYKKIAPEFQSLEEWDKHSSVYKKATITVCGIIRSEFQCLEGRDQNFNATKMGQEFQRLEK